MMTFLRSVWAEGITPLWRRPPAVQVAALCYRLREDTVECLLITSTEGRWILPKGWPEDGLAGHQAALKEAWEEAGVREGLADATAIGSFRSQKKLGNGVVVRCRTEVYPVRVLDLAKNYPEVKRRDRRWVVLQDAVQMATETGLKEILASFAP